MADDFLPNTLLETEEPEASEVEEKGSITEDMLRRILDDNRQANEALIARVTTPKGQPLQSDVIAPELEFTLEGLPDPALDPAGFHRGYAQRAKEAVQRALTQTREAITKDAQRMISDKDVLARTDAMIKAANPNLDDEIIAYAGGQIANRLKAQGKDPMSELRSNTESVAQAILDYTDDMASKLGGRRAADNEAATGRTRGLVAPRARTAAAPKAPGAGNDAQAFFKELTAFQQKARIY
jgi:hypothetical protein